MEERREPVKGLVYAPEFPGDMLDAVARDFVESNANYMHIVRMSPANYTSYSPYLQQVFSPRILYAMDRAHEEFHKEFQPRISPPQKGFKTRPSQRSAESILETLRIGKTRYLTEEIPKYTLYGGLEQRRTDYALARQQLIMFGQQGDPRNWHEDIMDDVFGDIDKSLLMAYAQEQNDCTPGAGAIPQARYIFATEAVEMHDKKLEDLLQPYVQAYILPPPADIYRIMEKQEDAKESHMIESGHELAIQQPFVASPCNPTTIDRKRSFRVTRTKAREILRHGAVHGKSLTERQRRYFGWIASGRRRQHQKKTSSAMPCPSPKPAGALSTNCDANRVGFDIPSGVGGSTRDHLIDYYRYAFDLMEMYNDENGWLVWLYRNLEENIYPRLPLWLSMFDKLNHTDPNDPAFADELRRLDRWNSWYELPTADRLNDIRNFAIIRNDLILRLWAFVTESNVSARIERIRAAFPQEQARLLEICEEQTRKFLASCAYISKMFNELIMFENAMEAGGPPPNITLLTILPQYSMKMLYSCVRDSYTSGNLSADEFQEELKLAEDRAGVVATIPFPIYDIIDEIIPGIIDEFENAFEELVQSEPPRGYGRFLPNIQSALCVEKASTQGSIAANVPVIGQTRSAPRSIYQQLDDYNQWVGDAESQIRMANWARTGIANNGTALSAAEQKVEDAADLILLGHRLDVLGGILSGLRRRQQALNALQRTARGTTATNISVRVKNLLGRMDQIQRNATDLIVSITALMNQLRARVTSAGLPIKEPASSACIGQQGGVQEYQQDAVDQMAVARIPLGSTPSDDTPTSIGSSMTIANPMPPEPCIPGLTLHVTYQPTLEFPNETYPIRVMCFYPGGPLQCALIDGPQHSHSIKFRFPSFSGADILYILGTSRHDNKKGEQTQRKIGIVSIQWDELRAATDKSSPMTFPIMMVGVCKGTCSVTYESRVSTPAALARYAFSDIETAATSTFRELRDRMYASLPESAYPALADLRFPEFIIPPKTALPGGAFCMFPTHLGEVVQPTATEEFYLQQLAFAVKQYYPNEPNPISRFLALQMKEQAVVVARMLSLLVSTFAYVPDFVVGPPDARKEANGIGPCHSRRRRTRRKTTKRKRKRRRQRRTRARLSLGPIGQKCATASIGQNKDVIIDDQRPMASWDIDDFSTSVRLLRGGDCEDLSRMILVMCMDILLMDMASPAMQRVQEIRRAYVAVGMIIAVTDQAAPSHINADRASDLNGHMAVYLVPIAQFVNRLPPKSKMAWKSALERRIVMARKLKTDLPCMILEGTNYYDPVSAPRGDAQSKIVDINVSNGSLDGLVSVMENVRFMFREPYAQESEFYFAVVEAITPEAYLVGCDRNGFAVLNNTGQVGIENPRFLAGEGSLWPFEDYTPEMMATIELALSRVPPTEILHETSMPFGVDDPRTVRQVERVMKKLGKYVVQDQDVLSHAAEYGHDEWYFELTKHAFMGRLPLYFKPSQLNSPQLHKMDHYLASLPKDKFCGITIEPWTIMGATTTGPAVTLIVIMLYFTEGYDCLPNM